MKTINKNKKKSYLTLSARSSSLFRPLLFSFFIALLFALFLSCECAVGTDNNPRSNNSEEDVTPADEPIISLSTNTLYETEATDNGSFDQTIDITFLLEGIDINPSLSSVFDTVLFNYPGDSTDPVGVSELPTGLGVILTQTSTGVQLSLAGNSSSHTRHTHNTRVEVTFLSNFFQTSELYTPADVSFSFDIVYGSKGGWLPRYSHQAFGYDNKIWVLGGEANDGNEKNDIWMSADNGTNWTQVAVNGTHWSRRGYHQAFAYNNKIWVLGGSSTPQNDIWTSADSGITWTEVSPTETHWAVRREHQAFVHNDKMWVLGGFVVNFSVGNDIWSSADNGLTWAEVSPTETHWAGRARYQAFSYNDKMWVLGGFDGSKKDDIWASADNGATWTEITPTGTHWSPRQSHQAFAYNDKMWVLGGSDDSKTNDIWTSADNGTNWTPVSPTGTYWSARSSHQAFAYNNKIWVLGGNGDGYKGDIWSSADEGETWQTWQMIGEFY